MPEHTIPESLVEHIQSGRAALVVGAGVGVPSWKQLLESMNAELSERGQAGDEDATKDVAKLLHKGSLVRAAGFLARRLGEEACDRIVAQTWKTPDEIPAVAAAIARLPFRHVWTTFPGDVLETAMLAEAPQDWPEPEVITYEHASEIRTWQRTVLKILGDFDSYIVTPKSVRAALSGATELRAYAQRVYSSGALVFVGFRFGDPDFSALLDRVFGMFEPPALEHYIVGSGFGPVTVDELRYEHHIEVINLPGKGGDDTATAALIEYLEDLAAACEAAGVTLAQTRPAADDLDGWLALLRESDVNEDTRVEAADAVNRIEEEARESGDAYRLIDVLVGQAEIETEPPARALILRQLAEVFETQIGDLPQAFTALTAALAAHPADTAAVDEAERLADETDGWSELVSDVSGVIDDIDDDEIAASYMSRLGRWYHLHLDHPDYAVTSYRQALKRDPDNLDAHLGLAELYRKQQRWAELADVLKAHVELEDDREKKIDLYLALGDLYETQLASTSRAIEAYQASADLDEDNDDALAALERLYRRDERWGKLAAVLERRAEKHETSDPPRAAAMRRELATLRAEKLGDLEGAIGKYESALETDDTDVEALRALENLYEKVGRTEDYLRTLERLIDVSSEGEQPAMLRRYAVEIEEREGGRAKAIEAFERLLSLEPAAADAYRALERMLRAEGDWPELVSLYDRHIEAVDDAADRVALYARRAEVYESQLDDPHSAIDSYLSAQTLDADNTAVLDPLARLYERIESWDRAVQTLLRHAELEGNRGAALWSRAGVIEADELGDPDTAEKHLEKALELDPTHAPSMLALARLHRDRGNWANAVQFLTQAEGHTQNRLERIEILIEAADLCENKLGDSERALELLMLVLGLDPENLLAGQRAVDALIGDERWRDALPLAEMLVRTAADGDREARLDRARAHLQLGQTYRALGRPADAAEQYRGAVEDDPDSLNAAIGLATCLYAAASEAEAEAGGRAETGSDTAAEAQQEAWQEVDRRYRETLARHGGTMPDEQVTDIWFHLGEIARKLGDDRKADGAYRRALDQDPNHSASLAALVEVAAARGDFHTVVEAKRTQLDALADGDGDDDDARTTLLEEIGDLCHKELRDARGAIAAYTDALDYRPDSHVLLHKLLDIYSEESEWARAVDVLETLAGHEVSAMLKSKYHYAAAVIARDELGDDALAVQHFDRVLDAVPDTEKAFDAIRDLLIEVEDYKGLARAYRRMLKRAGDDAPPRMLLALWNNLGDVCAQHLGDIESAIAAYEVAASIDPDDVDRHELLANLYLEAGESRRADAIEELQVLLQHAPDRVELYRALSRLYRDEGETDKAYCLAQALVFLNAASDDERALYESHRPEQLVLATRRLTDELWKQAVIHDREDKRLGAIFSLIMESVATTTAQPPSAFNLDDADRADPESDHRMVAKIFHYASNVLALEPQPQLYLQAAAEDGIRVANTRERGKLVPSVLVGKPHVRKKDEVELAFEVGKRLAYFRPDRYVSYALQTLPKLELAFTAALAAAGVRDADLPGDGAKMVKHIQKTVPRAVLEQVGAVAGKLAGQLENGLLVGWQAATDLTANRVGLILCNDLETAARLIATEPAGGSGMSAKDRLRELLGYAVSEPYFQVRRHMGLGVAEDA